MAFALISDIHGDAKAFDAVLAELARLENIGRQRLFHYVKFMPSRANPNGTLDRETIEAGIAKAVAEQGD